MRCPDEVPGGHAPWLVDAQHAADLIATHAHLATGPHLSYPHEADGRSEPPRKATVGNLIAAGVETVPDLAERQRVRVLANDRPGSLSHLVFESP